MDGCEKAAARSQSGLDPAEVREPALAVDQGIVPGLNTFRLGQMLDEWIAGVGCPDLVARLHQQLEDE